MKYAIAAIVAAALAMVISTCGQGDCIDLQQLMLQQVELVRTCGTLVSRARNSAEAVFAIDQFCASMEKLSPRAQRMLGKYPEIRNDFSLDRIPGSLQTAMKQIQGLDPILFKANAKLMQFSGVPAVEAARKKWESAMDSVSWRKMAGR